MGIEANGLRLHCAVAGSEDKPLLICLHGFPEFWAGWQPAMGDLARHFRVVVPDQRGFNLSSKPPGVDAYQARNMVADLDGLADHFSPGKPFVLAGHDWGASIAYAYAFMHPDRLSHLVIVNGVHPVCFQRAIMNDPDQRRASQYFHKLRAPDAARRLAENNYARMLKMLEGFSRVDWMTPAVRQRYREAWAQPNAMQAMLDWYHASPVVVPAPGAPAPDAPLMNMLADRARVSVPHLVVWGETDEALRPSCLSDLSHFVADLTIRRVAGAGHWIIHEKPQEVAAAIRTFVLGG